MKTINVTLERGTICELIHGGVLEGAMQNLLERIVNEEEGPDLENQVYLARQLVELDNLDTNLSHALRLDDKRRREETEAKEAVEV